MPLDELSYLSLVKRKIDVFSGSAPPSMPVIFQCFNVMDSPKAETYKQHVHEFCEVIAPISGLYMCSLNGTSITLHPDEMLFIQYEDRHEDFFQPAATFATLRFELADKRMKKPFPSAGNAHERITRLSASPTIAAIFKAFGEESGNDTMILGVMEGLCQAFFWKLMKAYPEKSLDQEFLRILLAKSARDILLAFFRESLAGQLDINEAALRLGVSRRKVYDICESSFGSPPSKAFMDFKMREAARCLLENNMKVKELAAKFGFDDPFHFSRAFKRCFGVPPSGLRSKK